MIGLAIDILWYVRWRNCNDSFSPFGSGAMFIPGSQTIVKDIISDMYIIVGSGFEPIIEISFDKYCSSCSAKIIIFYDNLFGSSY